MIEFSLQIIIAQLQHELQFIFAGFWLFEAFSLAPEPSSFVYDADLVLMALLV
ncbi:MAG: hypothetical protein GX130_09940 [Candidatus Hydrogenedens sp.]|jgi:hypothetical protein|nr:hypothetical protein [Candidatus Hydrogenedens sp.]